MAARAQRVWPSELLTMSVLVWKRWSSFKKCQRRGIPAPIYSLTVPQWTLWESLKLQRLARRQMAEEWFDYALLRRVARKWRAEARLQVRAMLSCAVVRVHRTA